MTGLFVVWGRRGTTGWVEDGSGCHIWVGARQKLGYGQVWHNGRRWYVHRLRYELEVGPIPPGMVMDHFRCNNPACCNPAHVRPVAQRENLLRSDTSILAIAAAKTHCPKGHPLEGANLRKRKRGRECRECDLIRKRRHARFAEQAA